LANERDLEARLQQFNGSMTGNPRFSTVFVLGIGHSGSTLLGRMLDMHPDVLCVGELLRLEQALAKPDTKCFCGELVSGCPFWTRWRARLPETVQRDYRKWDFALLDRMRASENRRVLVDLSKTRAYRLTKRWREPRVGYILLVRDPRGVLRSHLARGEDLREQLKVHRKWIGRLMDFAEDRRDRCLVMHYEDLVQSPEARTRGVCEFLGLEFVPELLRPDDKTHHLVKASGSSYLKGTNRFQLDERWRRELHPDVIAQISNCLKGVQVYRDRYGLAAA
jgi:hypothetical protein